MKLKSNGMLKILVPSVIAVAVLLVSRDSNPRRRKPLNRLIQMPMW